MPSPATDYFGLLGLARDFNMDEKALEDAYFKTQRQYHPDRFIGKSQAERQQALQRSVDANNAYNTLKDVHKRAVYLLSLEGIDVADNKNAAKPSQELLMETLQWREQVSDAQNPQALLSLQAELENLQSEATGHISQAFAATNWQTMAQHTMRLGYIIKTLGEIRQQKKRLDTLAS